MGFCRLGGRREVMSLFGNGSAAMELPTIGNLRRNAAGATFGTLTVCSYTKKC